jgi:hypothetical protein
MADYYDEGKMSEDSFFKMVKEREARAQQLNKLLEETESMLYINESAQVEVNTLKEIAAGVRDDLSTISAEQKKILVDLFVDRIELLQELDNDGNKKRTAHIYYRFNPKKWLEWQPMGCTEEPLIDNKKRLTDSQKDGNGEECNQSNFLYHFHVELLRQRSVRWNGTRNQCIDEVVVKNCN